MNLCIVRQIAYFLSKFQIATYYIARFSCDVYSDETLFDKEYTMVTG